MNKEIFRIAIPSIITNITVPLLGLLDTAIAGHLGAPVFIGAVAVGSMMFNLIYWNFGFLRMSTSGLTAQAYGSKNHGECRNVLQESVVVAMLIATAILLFQWPLQWLGLKVIGPSAEVARLARIYFYITIWGAPAEMLMMAAKGWLLGMQNSRAPMLISILVNVINIIASLVAVYVLKLGFIGIAMGTVASQWSGLALTAWLLHRDYGNIVRDISFRSLLRTHISRKYFTVSGDIFLRSLLLMLVNLGMVSIGARSGDLLLAVNALMQQLNTLFAYFLDGIAFAGEAITGKYYGARDIARMRQCVRRLFLWASALALIFTIIYAFPQHIFSLLTSEKQVVEAAMDYRWWCSLLPFAGMAAFVWDGVFIGLTRSRGMLAAVAAAAVSFFGLYFLLPQSMGNHRLWLAFVIYLATRGIVQTCIYPRYIRSTNQV